LAGPGFFKGHPREDWARPGKFCEEGGLCFLVDVDWKKYP